MKLRLFFYFLTILTVGVFCVFGQEKEFELKDKTITIKMEKQPLGVVFRHLMETYDIPIGFEESILDREIPDYLFQTNLPSLAQHKMKKAGGDIVITTTSERNFKASSHPITVNFSNVKLEKVLDEIVKQMSNYKWEINDDVVNIYPIKGRDEKFQALSDLMIEKFVFEEGSTVEDITTKIQSSREFLRFMYKNNLVFLGIRTGVNYELKAQYGRKLQVSMDFSKIKFRDLLNKITKIKRGGWSLRWEKLSEKTGKEYIDIDI